MNRVGHPGHQRVQRVRVQDRVLELVGERRLFGELVILPDALEHRARWQVLPSFGNPPSDRVPELGALVLSKSSGGPSFGRRLGSMMLTVPRAVRRMEVAHRGGAPLAMV